MTRVEIDHANKRGVARQVCRAADESGKFAQSGSFPFLSPAVLFWEVMACLALPTLRACPRMRTPYCDSTSTVQGR